jgi:type II secretory pathway component GspD/PulD (secretin)
MNNTPAVISSGQSFPIATSTQGFVGNGSSNGLLSNVQYQDVVLSLNIVPLINSADELTLQISQENSEATDTTTIAENEYPVLSKQLLNTVVMCRNGSTVLLGGLIRESKDKGKAGVPFLSNIPVLKYLTGSVTDEDRRRELLIFIEPRIVENKYDLPPNSHAGAGNSPFAREAMDFVNHEQRLGVEESKKAYLPPVKQGRIKALFKKMFGRDKPSEDDFPMALEEN